MDEIVGTNKSDTFNLGDDDDTVFAGNGKDIVYAGDGHDTVYGENGNDKLFGEEGNDCLFGGNGDDVVVGGAGDDHLSGGRGDDTFVFNFTVSAEKSTETVTAAFGQTVPGANAASTAWNNFLTQLAAWRAEMLANNGQDVDLAATSVTTKHLGSVTYDTSYKYLVSTTTYKLQGEGNDTVVDWSNGADKLVLNGLSTDASAVNYWDKWLSSEDDQDGQSIISFDGGSITLVGTDMTLADLVAGGYVQFA